MKFSALRSLAEIHTADIKWLMKSRLKAKRPKRFTLTVLRSLVQDHYVSLALKDTPTNKEEWRTSYSNTRKQIRNQLNLLHNLWVKGKCESYKMYPRGYAVALFSLLEIVKSFEQSNYALTRQYIEWARRFALLETLSAESPFRPLSVKKADPKTLLGLKYSRVVDEDEDEEASELKYRFQDESWRSLRERDYREREDYDDYEARQDFYSGINI